MQGITFIYFAICWCSFGVEYSCIFHVKKRVFPPCIHKKKPIKHFPYYSFPIKLNKLWTHFSRSFNPLEPTKGALSRIFFALWTLLDFFSVQIIRENSLISVSVEGEQGGSFDTKNQPFFPFVHDLLSWTKKSWVVGGGVKIMWTGNGLRKFFYNKTATIFFFISTKKKQAKGHKKSKLGVKENTGEKVRWKSRRRTSRFHPIFHVLCWGFFVFLCWEIFL